MEIYGKFVKHIAAPMVAQQSGLPFLFHHLHQFQQSQYWSRDRIASLQFERLRKLLIHAYQNTDFYKERFDGVGFDPYKFGELNELVKVPILTKKQIRDNRESFIAKNFRLTELHSSETGGTTGVKMTFFRNNSCLSQKEAALFRFEKWTGWNFGERMGLVWPAMGDYVGHWSIRAKIKNELYGRQVVFPAAVMDDESISRYLKIIFNKKPTMIRAFTSPIYEIAKFMLDKGIGGYSHMKGIVTTGEPLFKHQRKVISKAFSCDVYNSYRSREAGPIAQECEYHCGMHINAESLYVEIMHDENSNFEDSTNGKIIITDLLNYGMPLIRYDMGDIGSFSDKLCACGRGLPLIETIEGRTVDVFYTPEGKSIATGSLVLYLVDNAPGQIGQVQVVQESIDHLTIKMTRDPAPTEEIKTYQRDMVRKLFGTEMKVDFEIVDKINREPSGKYLFAKCLLKNH